MEPTLKRTGTDIKATVSRWANGRERCGPDAPAGEQAEAGIRLPENSPFPAGREKGMNKTASSIYRGSVAQKGETIPYPHLLMFQGRMVCSRGVISEAGARGDKDALLCQTPWIRQNSGRPDISARSI